MSFQKRLKKLRLNKKLTQQDVANLLGITRQAYGYYESETSKREPDLASVKKLAELFDVTTDYLLGRTVNNEINNEVTVAGQKITLSPEELKLFEELKKNPVLFHDLASNPEQKIKELIKLYKMKKILLEDDQEEADGFGELED
ncbi:MAG TPA: XRE family transcriptional regulator [Bacillus bacterium]|uniref:helix-turn-helix domain-containing protein n=1 Tax=Siminovitchia fordii TaxID=254759 RepID=UPI000360D046|nr:helix-turn-helix transcriptional regulator [Siminovitchia fordii]HBZ09158.1 XRE family transcriptional regulator [Bacillus sp. (in: firmicutes)]